MLAILPLASELNQPEVVAATLSRVADRLVRRGVAHRFVSGDDALPEALLILTGGTEHLALAAIERISGPVFLLAHPEQNSLPAALEILSRLRQLARTGRIFLLGGTGDADEPVARLARHLDSHRRLHAARLGRVGQPSDWLVASMPAAELVTAVWGPEVVDVPMAEVIEALRAADPGEVAAIRDELVAGAEAVREPSPADLDAAARVAAALRRVVREHRLDACSLRCFDLVMGERTTGCLALSLLLDEGVVAGCEGDVPAALTLLWLQAVTGRPGFMANPQDIDPATNTLALAHCTVARRLVSRYTLRSHFESSVGVGIEGEITPGPATVARIGGPDLRSLYASDAEVIAGGASPQRCRTQVLVHLDADVRELLARPLGNHHVLSPGHWSRDLREYHDLFISPGCQAQRS
jgi:L-fucose isomerase-like protein